MCYRSPPADDFATSPEIERTPSQRSHAQDAPPRSAGTNRQSVQNSPRTERPRDRRTECKRPPVGACGELAFRAPPELERSKAFAGRRARSSRRSDRRGAQRSARMPRGCAGDGARSGRRLRCIRCRRRRRGRDPARHLLFRPGTDAFRPAFLRATLRGGRGPCVPIDSLGARGRSRLSGPREVRVESPTT